MINITLLYCFGILRLIFKKKKLFPRLIILICLLEQCGTTTSLTLVRHPMTSLGVPQNTSLLTGFIKQNKLSDDTSAKLWSWLHNTYLNHRNMALVDFLLIFTRSSITYVFRDSNALKWLPVVLVTFHIFVTSLK